MGILLGLFMLILILGVPLGYTLGLTAWQYMVHADIPLSLISVRLNGTLTSFSMVAIPLFICAANIMAETGITKRLMDWCMSMVGWIRGGLSQVNVLLSIVFAGISGAALADVASIGQWEIPAMIKRGYKPAYAAAITSASSIVSPIIPPSICIIVAGIIAEESIAQLFMAGIMPGLVMGLGLMIVAYIIAVKEGHPKEAERFDLKDFFVKTRDAALDLVLPVLIIGGIRFGWFTPTEGAGMALVYALLLGGVIHRELTWEKIVRAFKSGLTLTGAVLLMVGLASTFSFLITLERLPDLMAAFVSGLNWPSWALLFVVLVFLLMIGMFMDGLSAIIIFLPVLLPLQGMLGMSSPIQLIIFVVVAICIGVITPPVGVCLFLSSGIAKVDILSIAKATLPFLAVLMLVVILMGFFPALTTWLPSML